MIPEKADMAKKTIVRIISTKLGEKIGDFERIDFDENNEIFICQPKKRFQECWTYFCSNIATQKTKRLPKKKIGEDKVYRLLPARSNCS